MSKHLMVVSGPVRRPAPRAVLVLSTWLAVAAAFAISPAQAQQRTEARFSHEPHRNVTCVSCHASNRTGLGPAHVTDRQCQDCHHSGPVGAACTRCHQSSELTRPIELTQQFRLSVSPQPIARTLQLSHQQHGGLECRVCHNKAPRTDVKALPCGSCHEQHHKPDANCLACHQTRPGGAHANSAHLGCGGSACHLSTPLAATTRTRQMCLACHADRVEHYPAANCVECHAMPGKAAARR